MVKSELSKYAAAPEGTPIYTNIVSKTHILTAFTVFIGFATRVIERQQFTG